jgi:hypothetical protein
MPPFDYEKRIAELLCPFDYEKRVVFWDSETTRTWFLERGYRLYDRVYDGQWPTSITYPCLHGDKFTDFPYAKYAPDEVTADSSVGPPLLAMDHLNVIALQGNVIHVVNVAP